MAKVLVTGASGFIASHLVKQLLERGYVVLGTVRDVSNAAKTAHLTSLPGAADRLTLVNADLLEAGSFDDAVKGVEGVFHTASPFFFKDVTDPDAQLLRPAEEGTLNVLRAVDKAGHKPRVVVTSSIAAIYVNGGAMPEGHVYTEADWSHEEYMRSKGIWYPLSKTLAEKAAWKFVEDLPDDRKFSVVTVNPVLVTGRMLQPTLNTSSEIIQSYIDGSRGAISNACAALVDVEDVAESHIAVFEKKETAGRHLCASLVVPYATVAERLAALFPASADKVPKALPEGKTQSTPDKLDNSKLRALLGRDFKDLDFTLRTTVESLVATGHLPADTAAAAAAAGSGAGSGSAAAL